jgi:predicted aconitase
MLDVVVALTGRAPEAGPHIATNRAPTLVIKVDPGIANAEEDDSAFWPLLGYAVGESCGHEIPLVCGLEQLAHKPRVSDLKAFGAAFATTSGAAMFHIASITPEADEYSDTSSLRTVDIGPAELAAAWTELNSAQDPSVGLVALGNPHLSLDEFEQLAWLMEGKHRAESTPVILTAGRHIVAEAEERGYLAPIKAFGAQIITDTCWCMLGEPVVPPEAANIMTNSAKYAHYGAGATSKGMHFGNTAACVEAACTGVNRVMPEWLNAVAT